MEVHGYTESGSISATIDGQQMSIPDNMANRHRQMIAEWEAEGNTIPAFVPPGITVAEVKAEVERRILEVMPEHMQRNTLAAGLAAVTSHGNSPSAWPQELRDRNTQAMAAWQEIERLRAKSNEIEAMDPLPVDITDDALWAAE